MTLRRDLNLAAPIRPADKDDLEVGHICVNWNQVVGEARIGDPADGGVEDGLLEHCHSDTHDCCSNDLAARQFLVQDSTAVDAKHRSRVLAEMRAGSVPAADELQRLGWVQIPAVADSLLS